MNAGNTACYRCSLEIEIADGSPDGFSIQPSIVQGSSIKVWAVGDCSRFTGLVLSCFKASKSSAQVRGGLDDVREDLNANSGFAAFQPISTITLS